jgi:hypothetical protein
MPADNWVLLHWWQHNLAPKPQRSVYCTLTKFGCEILVAAAAQGKAWMQNLSQNTGVAYADSR